MDERKSIKIEEGNATMILVRSDLQKGHKDSPLLKPNVLNRVEQFHIVDLMQDKIYCDCLPSLPNPCGAASLVALPQSRSIFIFGGDFEDKDNLFTSHYHGGASHLRFNPQDLNDRGTWGPAPVPLIDGYAPLPIYTALHGDVYTFGHSVLLAPAVLRFDYAKCLGSWTSFGPLPSELIGCLPSSLVIPDPVNDRILVHLEDGSLPSPSLYAFYPQDATWQCVWSEIPFLWDEVWVACLLDGILYLHCHEDRDRVFAYEVATAKKLDVKWSTQVTNTGRSLDYCHSFDAFFCLDDANKILCLAAYSPVIIMPPKTNILFLTFKAERCDSTIWLTPDCFHEYAVPCSSEVLDFVLI